MGDKPFYAPDYRRAERQPTPGFKVPRQVQVEILSIDGRGLSRGIQDRLSDAELRIAYENRRSEFEQRGELPSVVKMLSGTLFRLPIDRNKFASACRIVPNCA